MDELNMRSGGVMTCLRRGLLALGILCGVWIAHPVDVAQGRMARLSGAGPDASEIRALWVTRTSLTSPATVIALVRTAHEQGFNTLLVQGRGRADAYYPSDVAQRPAEQ